MNKQQYNYKALEHDACGIGAVVNIDGHQDHAVLSDALTIVEKLEHRAGKDATGKVGDGVGILAQISDRFFRKAAKEEGFDLPGKGEYGIAMCFLPTNSIRRRIQKRLLEVMAVKSGVEVIGWREVVTSPEILGQPAVDCMPQIEQCFFKKPADCEAGMDFDRKLYVIRREFEQSSQETYICSMSSRTIVYKGMFLVGQLRRFYADLQDPSYETAIAVVHSRFSTNTTPSWFRAHPYRMIAHNGEINTIRGNIDRMLAREETMSSPVFGDDVDKIYPVVNNEGSDSAMLDNTLEFLYMSGMPLPLAMMTIVPEPWRHDATMDPDKRDFYHYYATMMEPWDGPAAILFTDGEVLGATLDRNGLRPSRYYVTKDGRLILASEVGVLDIPESQIIKKSRLEPGRILLVDTKEGRIIDDSECKMSYAKAKPYGEWLDQNMLHLESLKVPNRKVPSHPQEVRDRLYKVFGYSYEDVKEDIMPMAANGIEPTVSMGHDTPLAVLDEKKPLLYSYFKQLFAQVTNPPIDSLREKIVTDTTVYIGSDGDLLGEKAANCRMLEVKNPLLTGVDVMKIQELDRPGFSTATISMLYYKNTSLKRALDQLNLAVDRAYAAGKNILILSDRGVDENHMPIPALLAVSSVEQHLVRTKKRTAVSLILESGEPRDVHQIATLLGFGVRAIHPYLAHECIAELIDLGILDKDYHTAIEDYNKALLSGVVKIAAKMGISTMQSYQSARIFEAVGLDQDLVDTYFTGVVSPVGGKNLDDIGQDVCDRHDAAFDPLDLAIDTTLDSTGEHGLRSNSKAEDHLYDPKTIVLLQQAVRRDSYDTYKEYAKRIDDPARPHTLRSQLKFVSNRQPIPLDQVESVEEIVKHFKTGAMSYGSLSQEAHECLAEAMNRLGAKSNTGEGGESIARYGTEKNSAIKQVASGRFGVTSAYLNSASEIQIKMAQGAKPGEGGHLPGKKVYPWVAATRYSTPGVSLISPPPHHDIYSIEDLAQLIYDLKNANRDARISVKLVSEAGVGTIASGVAKAGAQVILISGYDGGTGAAPISSVHHAGLPWELGLSEAHQCLVDNGLRDKVVIETDGKLMTGRDVAIAAMLGAEEFGFATAPLVCMGCMMMRVCSKDTCPAGIATQNETLRARFAGKPEHVMNFMLFTAMQLREIMAELGFATLEEMVGRKDCLAVADNAITSLDLTALLGHTTEDAHLYPKNIHDFKLEETLDMKVLLPTFKDALAGKKKAVHNASVAVSSTDRSFGTILGSEVTRRFGDSLAEGTFTIEARGGGGQSFGAFLPKGVSIRLIGDANDGFGKGLSGGTLAVMPPKDAGYVPDENIIIGNVAGYGATAGKIYACGIAGERFGVRNSGATLVTEGCGDHGLEYMTGGRAVILGSTGKNFAAGMSGGIAYVLDEDHSLYRRMNVEMDTLQEVTDKYDIAELCDILTDYVKATGSAKAKKILENPDEYMPKFKKIVPEDYQRMLTAISHYEQQGISYENAVFEAFREVTA